jgi:hypothetical protein
MKELTNLVAKSTENVPQIPMIGNLLVDPIIMIANWMLAIGAAIGAFFFGIGEMIGQALWDFVILPAGNFISGIILKVAPIIYSIIINAWAFMKNLGLSIWNIIKTPWEWLKSVGVWIWNILKAPFQAVADAIGAAVSAISSAWGSVKRFFGGKQLDGPIAEEGMYYLHRGERVISATERGGGGGNVSLNLTINNPTIRKDADIRELVRQINKFQQENMRRYVSYG